MKYMHDFRNWQKTRDIRYTQHMQKGIFKSQYLEYHLFSLIFNIYLQISDTTILSTENKVVNKINGSCSQKSLQSIDKIDKGCEDSTENRVQSPAKGARKASDKRMFKPRWGEK